MGGSSLSKRRKDFQTFTKLRKDVYCQIVRKVFFLFSKLCKLFVSFNRSSLKELKLEVIKS